jgi:hypothetical protein
MIAISYSKESGILTVQENTSTTSDEFVRNESINNALDLIKTNFDELGPYLIPTNDGYAEGKDYFIKPFQSYILMFSNDSNGNFDIKYTFNDENNDYDTIIKMDKVNSFSDEQYPCLSDDKSKIFWTSNINGNFDIFSKDVIFQKTFPHFSFIDSDSVNLKVSNLCSKYNDKCPFLFDNYIVFASDREGGYGGYDLYYSEYINENWTKPINMGKRINSEYDEYRPIVKPLFDSDFNNDLMIFSSNRPGGKGGFDLYYVGVSF